MATTNQISINHQTSFYKQNNDGKIASHIGSRKGEEISQLATTEIIDIDEILFVRSSWTSPKGCQSEGNEHLKIVFKNGFEADVHLTETGYAELIKLIGVI
jgi:hypothetical protein